MDEFVNYLLNEFNLPKEVVCYKTEFNFSQKNRIDKKSHIPITHNVMGVKIDCFDKEHNKLATINERFVDDQIKRPKNKKLINISPDELNNKFNAAKGYICSRIMNSNAAKMDELKELMKELSTYCPTSTIIPSEFIREPTIASDDSIETNLLQEPKKNKKQFEF